MRNRRLARTVGLAALALLVVAVAGRQMGDFLGSALEWIRGLGGWAVLAYVALYALAAVLWVPGSLLTVASGAIFGPWMGTGLTLIGATSGAVLAFLVSRHLARGRLEARLRSHHRLRAIDEAIGREGGRIVFLLRLSPVVPFNALNYALGLMPIRLGPYAVASFLGMAPGSFAYVFGGYAVGVTAGLDQQTDSPGSGILLVVGLLATVVLSVLLARTARRALARATDDCEQITAGLE